MEKLAAIPAERDDSESLTARVTRQLRLAIQDDIGSTRMTSRFIVAPLNKIDRCCKLAWLGAIMIR